MCDTCGRRSYTKANTNIPKSEKKVGDKETEMEMMNSPKDSSVDNMMNKMLVGDADEGRGTMPDAR